MGFGNARTAALILVLAAGAPAAIAAAPVEKSGCAPVAGIEKLLRPGRIVLLGEIHGTAESPAFVGTLVCHALEAGLEVTVGLELLQADQGRLDVFLDSGGTPADREAFVATPFWAKDYQDGRTSEAMFRLIDSLRDLRERGQGVRAVLIDDLAGGFRGRDRAMADALALARVDRPQDLVVALMGNIHNRMVPGTPWNADYEPAGYLLRTTLPDADLVSLGVSHTGGSAWICQSGEPCKVQRLGGHGSGDGPAITMGEAADPHGLAGHYFVGAITASLPAARRAPAVPAERNGDSP